MSKRIFIITGEYSGDIHASHVVRALKEKAPDICIEGIGSENMQREGVKLFADHKKMSSVGLSPSIIINHIRLGQQVVNYITNEFRPDAVLLVDYGGFNLRVAKYIKQAGIKVLYYIPPQVWASRKGRIKKINQYVQII